ncbi:hypothetical protein E2562_006188 [Oryza meyeriana var. granulata]|uniref:Uncharacterized protein n=1 Tax=Oryza meyeriana var. granulata TaxID=110450 RepID=A0A6G1CNI6_9ORYZ|nr:hypothetical protein E2562_006188 [Oryza meyeriana var. granulata]
MDAGGGGHGGAAVAAAGVDDADAAFFSRRGNRCCCFWGPWASSSSYSRPAGGAEEWWHHVGERGGGGERRRWWRRGVDALMKVREWSELVAGPRWKTFIRRFRRSPRPHGGGGGGRKLNYDPLSYALNFDEGHGGACCPDDDYAGYRDFSTRFIAPPPSSAKSSMDLGGRDAPPLFHHPPRQ